MGMLLAAASAQTANLPGDAETAPHGDGAADVQLVEVRAVNMEGGSEAWIAAGLPTLGAAGGGHGGCAPPRGPSNSRNVWPPRNLNAC